MARRGFNFRSFTAFILTWTFLTLVVSGAVLYIAPPGRIANWTRWQLIILTKEQWQAVHTLTAVAFLVGGLFHLLKFKRNMDFRARLRFRALPRKGSKPRPTTRCATSPTGAAGNPMK